VQALNVALCVGRNRLRRADALSVAHDTNFFRHVVAHQPRPTNTFKGLARFLGPFSYAGT